MSITGICLVLFVTFHALMNGVALFWPSAYNEVCLFLGANWYALIASAGLAVLFILHIIYALWLTVQNRKARGAERYDVTTRPKQVEWSSKNMLVLGLVVLAFLVFHLIQFWCKMQFAEICGFEVTDSARGDVSVPPAAGTYFLAMAFRQPLTLPIYLVAFIALWFHMTHGFWSMMQSIGWNNDTWMNRIKCIGNTWTTVVIALFVAEAIVFTVQANRGTYYDCPVLQEQYMEMAAHGESTFTIAPAGACCGGAAAQECTGAGECAQAAPQSCCESAAECTETEIVTVNE